MDTVLKGGKCLCNKMIKEFFIASNSFKQSFEIDLNKNDWHDSKKVGEFLDSFLYIS